jgi:hypothetical protein
LPANYAVRLNWLFQLLPVDCGADSEYSATKFQLVCADEFSGYVYADALRGVVDFCFAPLFILFDIFESLYNYNFVDVYIAEILVGVVDIFTLFAICVVGVLYPEELCFVCAVG